MSVDFNILARSLMLARGDRLEAAIIAQQTPGASARAIHLVRSAVDVGSTTSPGYTSLTDYQTAETSFIASLSSIGIWDRMVGDNAIRTVPLRTRIISSTTVLVASAVGEASPKPVRMLSLNPDDLPLMKTAAILVVSDDVVKLSPSGSLAFIGAELKNAIVAGTDQIFLTALMVGETPITSSGSDIASIGSDLGALLGAVKMTASSRPYYVTSPAIAKSLGSIVGPSGLAFDVGPSGGNLGTIPLLVSDQIPLDVVMLVDAGQIIGNSEPVTLDASSETSLLLDDAPAGGAAAPTNLWQRNLYGLRAERSIAFRASPDAVAVLDGVSWGTTP